MNTKLHAVTDAIGRPITCFMSAGHVSDYTGAAALLRNLPKADWLIADRGYCEGVYPIGRDCLAAAEHNLMKFHPVLHTRNLLLPVVSRGFAAPVGV